MLVFIDESGDPGLKIESGSSKYFVVSLVIFEDNQDAIACDQRIQLLKTELGWKPTTEFHYKRNSKKVRESFIRSVLPYNFFYYGIAIDKSPGKLYGEGFKNKASFYKYACSLVFENAKDKIAESIVVIDQSGNLEFRRRLTQYLKLKMNKDGNRIRKLKQQRSESNNLLQLADYISGIIYNSLKGKEHSEDLRKLIAHREMYVQTWPK